MTARGSGSRSQLMAAVRQRYDGSAAQEFARDLRSLNFVNTITLFGATFLLSALPFLILMSSFANRRIDDDLSQHLGLNAQAAGTVEQLFRTPSAHSTSAVLLAVVLTAAGTVGVASCVQSAYEQIFAQTHRRRGNLARLLLWVAGLSGWLVLDTLIATATNHLPVHFVVDGLGVLVATTVFFWWSMHLLLAGTVPWRHLLRSAVVTAVFWLGLEAFAALYFSSTITSDSRLYGSVGVVFSLLTWFIAIAAVLVLGALTGSVWESRRGVRKPSAPRARPDDARPAAQEQARPGAPQPRSGLQR